MRPQALARWNSFTQSMDKLPRDLRNFLYGGLGYMLGAAAGLLFLWILSWLELGRWLVGLIPEGQSLLAVLAVPLLAGVFLGIGGGIAGMVGGWSLGHILGLKRKRPIILDSAVAFAASQGLLLLVFLILLSLFSVYNNFNVNRVERFGLIFGLYGLVFGLFTGIILAFMSVRLRHTWRVLLAALLGFTLAGAITGALLRLFSPAGGYTSLAAAIALLAFLLLFYFIGGGVLGWAYGRLAARLQRDERLPESALPPLWQEISTAAIGVIVVISALSLLGQISRFLVIDPAAVPSQLVTETLGVRYSPAGPVPLDAAASTGSAFEQPSLAVDSQGTHHLVWRSGSAEQPAILYSRCQDGTCSPPQVISASAGLPCLAGAASQPSQPAIAIDAGGTILSAWHAGGAALVYTTWDAAGTPPQTPAGCVPGLQGEVQGDLSLASPAAGSFTLAFASGGTLYTSTFDGSGWSAAPSPLVAGAHPSLAAGPQGELHLAYCDAGGGILYRSPAGDLQPLDGVCLQPPALALGGDNQPHLAWYADQLLDVNGLPRPASVIVESVLTGGGWSEPVVAATTAQPVEPALASDPAGALTLLWSDTGPGGGQLQTAAQPVYACDPASLNPIEQAGLAAIQGGGTRPAGQPVPFCGNKFNAIWYAPNPGPGYGDALATENGVFDRTAQLVEVTRYEVLFTTMQYEPQSSPPSPGVTLAQAVAQLYHKVKDNPQLYPRGMTVRILLGNYPVMSTFQWGDQIWSVMEDLRDAGLETLVDEDIGWRVEIANYAGTYPHAHTKFMVVDGATVVGAGFNYGYLHLPKDHPSGLGYDLFDLALGVTGPVAQDALVAYDMMWQGADEVACATLAGDDWRESCVEKSAQVSHSPEVLHTYLPEGGQDSAFSLLRTYDFLEGDAFVSTALRSATETIDMMQVNFSLEIICMADLIFPGLCDFDNALPYMTAMMDAIERDQVRVRVIMENSNSNGLENRVGGRIFMDELERRGLDEYVELRFYDGKVHAKSTLVDGELLMIGSMNMHYSSWGSNALAEYVVTTGSPQAIAEYEQMFEIKWEAAVPFEEAEYSTTP